MPELPEVEVLRRSLEPSLVGDVIEDVVVHNAALREPVARRSLVHHLKGRRVAGLRRRAKYLLIDLERNATFTVHLGMSGRLTLVPEEAPLQEHEHVALRLRSGRRLRLRDPRRFGLAFALPTDRVDRDRHFAHLGVEPLESEFTGELLRSRAAGRRAPVKNLLMDARVVVGVGNIYASEALFRAGIHPRRSVARIARRRWDRLAAAVRDVLHEAIDQGGTTLNDFADANGDSGYFQVSLSVYGRQDEACGRCGRALRRIVQAGRSTYYCPRCQR